MDTAGGASPSWTALISRGRLLSTALAHGIETEDVRALDRKCGLCLSRRAVHDHGEHRCRALNVETRTAAAAIALQSSP